MGTGKMVKCKKCGNEWLHLEISKEEKEHIINDLEEPFEETPCICSEFGSTEYEVIPNVHILWD